MAPVNTMIDDLYVHLPEWSFELPMYQLMEEANNYIGKFFHNSESTGHKIDSFSSKPSKQDEKDKTTEKYKIEKENFSS